MDEMPKRFFVGLAWGMALSAIGWGLGWWGARWLLG